MDELSDDDLARLRIRLGEIRDALRVQLEHSTDGARPVDLDQPIGRLARMDALQQQSMLNANRIAARQRRQQVEGALRRMDEGDYGDCARCGEAIELGRLEARPEAPLCLACQSRHER